jgi:hypothetical protein
MNHIINLPPTSHALDRASHEGKQRVLYELALVTTASRAKTYGK